MPAPQLQVYPQHSVIAEKFEAIVSLGMANTRMKDYFDLWVMARHTNLDRIVLAQAVLATFNRRGTPIPTSIPRGLSDEFAQDQRKAQQWQAFLRKNQLAEIALPEVVETIRPMLLRAITEIS